MECVYLNTSLATSYTTTLHPFLPVQQNTPLHHTVLAWTFNNRTFSLKNRKRLEWKSAFNKSFQRQYQYFHFLFSSFKARFLLTDSITFRVHTYWTGHSVVSILSIKSAITEDSGNYSCILSSSGEKVTASLVILKGEEQFSYHFYICNTPAWLLLLSGSVRGIKIENNRIIFTSDQMSVEPDGQSGHCPLYC